MKLSNIGALDLLLSIACAAVLLTNAWFTVPVLRETLRTDALSAAIEEETQNARRLRSIDDVSSLANQLAQLEARLARAPEQVVPRNVDNIGLVFSLLDFVPGSGARLLSFREQDVKSQTINEVAFKLLSYEITLEGNPFDMLTMVKRVDQNPLASLTVPSMALAKGEREWSLKAVVVARVPAAVQPVVTRAAQPTVSPPTRSFATPSPSPGRR